MSPECVLSFFAFRVSRPVWCTLIKYVVPVVLLVLLVLEVISRALGKDQNYTTLPPQPLWYAASRVVNCGALHWDAAKRPNLCPEASYVELYALVRCVLGCAVLKCCVWHSGGGREVGNWTPASPRPAPPPPPPTEIQTPKSTVIESRNFSADTVVADNEIMARWLISASARISCFFH